MAKGFHVAVDGIGGTEPCFVPEGTSLRRSFTRRHIGATRHDLNFLECNSVTRDRLNLDLGRVGMAGSSGGRRRGSTGWHIREAGIEHIINGDGVGAVIEVESSFIVQWARSKSTTIIFVANTFANVVQIARVTGIGSNAGPRANITTTLEKRTSVSPESIVMIMSQARVSKSNQEDNASYPMQDPAPIEVVFELSQARKSRQDPSPITPTM